MSQVERFHLYFPVKFLLDRLQILRGGVNLKEPPLVLAALLNDVHGQYLDLAVNNLHVPVCEALAIELLDVAQF